MKSKILAVLVLSFVLTGQAHSASEASYIIHKSDGVYYADTDTYSDFSDTSFSEVLSQVMGSLPQGGLVLIKEGTYVVDAPISPVSNITVKCLQSKIENAPNIWTFQNTSADSINNLVLEGCNVNNKGTESAGGGFVKLYNVTGFTMRDTEIYTTTYTGPDNLFYLYNSSNILIDNNYIHDNGGTGIFLQGANGYRITNNRFKLNLDNSLDITHYEGGGTQQLADGYIAGNLLEDSGKIFVWGHSRVVITGNTVRKPRGSGIEVNNYYLGTGKNANDIVISNNVVNNCGNAGDGGCILVRGAANSGESKLSRVIISNNIITNDIPVGAPNWQDGITVQNGENISISGNQIIGQVPFKTKAIRVSKDSGTTQSLSCFISNNRLVGGTIQLATGTGCIASSNW